MATTLVHLQATALDPAQLGQLATLDLGAQALLDGPHGGRIVGRHEGEGGAGLLRAPRAPDQNLLPDDVDLDVVREVPVFWVPASRFAWEPSRSTVTELLHARDRREHTVLDLDWRPMFWDSPAAATEQIAPILDHVTVAIGNRDECEIAVGTRDPDEAADRLLERGVSIAVVKLGGDGVMVATADGIRERIPPFRVDVVCGLGAGDAFGGAFCHGLLSGWDLVRTVEYGNAAGAIVAGRLTCADAMPTVDEVDDFISLHPIGATS